MTHEPGDSQDIGERETSERARIPATRLNQFQPMVAWVLKATELYYSPRLSGLHSGFVYVSLLLPYGSATHLMYMLNHHSTH